MERQGKCRAVRVTAHAITLLLRIVFLASARAVVTVTDHVNVKDATSWELEHGPDAAALAAAALAALAGAQ